MAGIPYIDLPSILGIDSHYATLTGALYPHPNKLQLLNAAAWVFPFHWILVRLGCFLAHDQQARPHRGPLAVNYPTCPCPCHDLALYEILYAATLAIVFFQSRQKQWPFAAILVTTYGILRLKIHTVDLVGAWFVLAAGLTWLICFSPREQHS